MMDINQDIDKEATNRESVDLIDPINQEGKSPIDPEEP